MPGPGVYIITDNQGVDPPIGLVIAKVPWFKIWEGYVGGDLVYRVAKPCRKYDKHKNPYIHWDWVSGIGMVTPVSGGMGKALAGPEAGTILTNSSTGVMSYKSVSGSFWGSVTPGNVVDPNDPTIPDCRKP